MRLLFASLLLCSTASAQAPAYKIQRLDEVQWKTSGTLPPGVEYTLLHEQPGTHAVQLLVKFPKGYALPSHSLTHDETIVVLKGKLELDFGTAPTTLGPGDHATLPAGLNHSLKAKNTVIMLVLLDGPWEVKGLPSEK